MEFFLLNFIQVSILHILSAAHCFLNVDIEDMRVILGAHNITSTTESKYMQIHTISKVLTHENYSEVTSENDIAIVYLSREIILNYGASRVCLPFR